MKDSIRKRIEALEDAFLRGDGSQAVVFSYTEDGIEAAIQKAETARGRPINRANVTAYYWGPEASFSATYARAVTLAPNKNPAEAGF